MIHAPVKPETTGLPSRINSRAGANHSTYVPSPALSAGRTLTPDQHLPAITTPPHLESHPSRALIEMAGGDGRGPFLRRRQLRLSPRWYNEDIKIPRHLRLTGPGRDTEGVSSMPSQPRTHVSPGQRFGRLTVLTADRFRTQPSGHRVRLCLARCDCGTEVTVKAVSLSTGHTRSCGCYHRDTIRTPFRSTHGQTGTRLHRIWGGMKARCLNPKNR